VLRQADAPNAYVQTDIDRPVYVQQPEGFEQDGPNGERLVLKLKKSLYGLHQSGRLWVEMVLKTLDESGYVSSPHDRCLMRHPDSGVTFVIYVDDIFVSGTKDTAAIDEAMKLLHALFECKDLGFPSKFLGIAFERAADGGIIMQQVDYVNELLARHGMREAHQVHTPHLSGEFSDDSPLLDSAATAEYHSLVGGLGWLATCTRPDIAHAVSTLQRHMQAPRRCHMEAAKRVLRYLKGHAIGLHYARGADGGGAGPEAVCYVDASFASDPATCHSTTGYAYMLAGAAVIWHSKLQTLVTLSTAEAEYVALSTASKDVYVVVELLAFLGIEHGAVPFYEDNMAAERLATDESAARRTRHIAVKYHHIREKVQNGEVQVVHVCTRDQHADVLTKALPVDQHHYHTKVLMGIGAA
jgi:hypothetical protein